MCSNEAMSMTPLECLEKYYGHSSFRATQKEIISTVMAGHDALALMPTSGGKSVCFQIPGLLRPGICIVVSPLISLMKDQVDNLHKKGIRATMITSESDEAERNSAFVAARNDRLDFIYVSPERMMTQSMIDLISEKEIALFAIDEAHCVSTWGHSFRPEYSRLAEVMAFSPDTPRLAVTATANEQTQKDIYELLELDGPVFVQSFLRENITISCSENDSQDIIDDNILQEVVKNRDSKGIIYCLTRKECTRIGDFLTAQGLRAHVYHAGLEREDRELVQARFAHGPTSIMIATMGFGMGIDIPDIRYVIHNGLPGTAEAYYQEIGRGGRDGRQSKAIAFYTPGTTEYIRKQCDARDNAFHNARNYAQALLGNTCRVQGIMKCLGETIAEPCGKCDACKRPAFDMSSEESIDIIDHILRITRDGQQNLSLKDYVDMEDQRASSLHNMDQAFINGFIDYDTPYNQFAKSKICLSEKGLSWLNGERSPVLLVGREFPEMKNEIAIDTKLYTERQKQVFNALVGIRETIALDTGIPDQDILSDGAINELTLYPVSTVNMLHNIKGSNIPERYAERIMDALSTGRRQKKTHKLFL